MAKNKVKAATDESAPAANQFTLDGKKYNVTKGALIPFPTETMKLTAADICADAEAQAYLVANGSSCIEEVIE